MSIEFSVRLVGMAVLAIGGSALGVNLANSTGGANFPSEVWGLVVALLGALIGLIVTPFVTTRPVRGIRARLNQAAPEVLIASVIGLVIGLIVAALVSFPVSLLPEPFGQVLPVVGAIIFSYFGISVMVMRRGDLLELFQGRLP